MNYSSSNNGIPMLLVTIDVFTQVSQTPPPAKVRPNENPSMSEFWSFLGMIQMPMTSMTMTNISIIIEWVLHQLIDRTLEWTPSIAHFSQLVTELVYSPLFG